MTYYCRDCRNIADFTQKFYYTVDRTEYWAIDNEGDQVDCIDSEDTDSDINDSEEILCAICNEEAEYEARKVTGFTEDGELLFDNEEPIIKNWKERVENDT